MCSNMFNVDFLTHFSLPELEIIKLLQRGGKVSFKTVSFPVFCMSEKSECSDNDLLAELAQDSKGKISDVLLC